MTASDLKTRTVRDLALMAKRKKVRGWHAMKKDELVRALVRRARTDRQHQPSGNGSSGNGSSGNGDRPSHIPGDVSTIQTKLAESKDLTFRNVGDGNEAKDRLVVMVRDPYWLHAYWELSRRSIERARVALGQYWHGARPVLRLYEVVRDGTTNSARRPIRDIEIHGGVNNWYIDVHNPAEELSTGHWLPAPGGRFFCLARSNVVSTPAAASGDTFDRNWADVAKDFDRIFALSGGYSEPEANGELKEVLEERLQRPIGDSLLMQFGPGRRASRRSRTSISRSIPN